MSIIPYGRQHITDEDIKSVIEVLRSDFLTQGPQIDLFEKKFSEYVGSKYAIAVSNATAGLHISCLALGLKPGDKVLSTPISFVASSNCVRYCGADVEFIDIEDKYFCINYELLEEKLKKNSSSYKGIIAVDFAGYPLNMELLQSLAKKYGLWIIEDACHAVGAEFRVQNKSWVKAGSGLADISIFSFHPVKHITTLEGGMITTNDSGLYEKLKSLRSHGITKDPSKMSVAEGPWSYEMQELGFNYRLTDVACALGISQLKRIDKNLVRRRQIADIYRSELKDLPIVMPVNDENAKHAYHLFVVLSQERNRLFSYLRENDIYSQVHYIPIYKQPYYQNLYGVQLLETAESYYKKTLSLPMYHSLTDPELEKTISAVKKFYE